MVQRSLSGQRVMMDTHKVALFGVMVASMARTTKFMDIYLEDCSAI
jgi:hypothetical protein